jgi:hypothetical protein
LTPHASEPGHRRILVDARPVPHTGVGEARAEPSHVHLRALPVQQPAMEAVRADFVAYARWRDELGVRIGLAMQQLEAAGDLLVVAGLGRELDLAAAAEIAGDLVIPYQALHRIHRVVIGAVQQPGAL